MIFRIHNNQLKEANILKILVASMKYLSNAQIAKILGVSISTVKRYKKADIPKPDYNEKYIDFNLQQMGLLGLDVYTYATALMISSFCNGFKRNSTFVSIKRMSKILNIDKRIVSKSIKKLGDMEIIKIETDIVQGYKIRYKLIIEPSWVNSFKYAPNYKIFGNNENLPKINQGKREIIELENTDYEPEKIEKQIMKLVEKREEKATEVEKLDFSENYEKEKYIKRKIEELGYDGEISDFDEFTLKETIEIFQEIEKKMEVKNEI